MGIARGFKKVLVETIITQEVSLKLYRQTRTYSSIRNGEALVPHSLTSPDFFVCFLFWKLLFFWTPIRHGSQLQFPLDLWCEFGKWRSVSEFVSLYGGPPFAQDSPSLHLLSSIIINSAFFYSEVSWFRQCILWISYL